MRRRKHHHAKAQADRIHAKRRATQRFGLILNKVAYRELVQRIQGPEPTYVRKLSNTRSLHVLNVEGRWLWVVYSRRMKTIVTFLPDKGE